MFINLKDNKIVLVSDFSQTQLYCCESIEITNKMQPCNRIYYSKIYCRLNMFRAAYRSSSGAPNCICSIWFIYPCGDRPLFRLGGNMFRAANRSSSGAPKCICSLWFIHPCGDQPLSRLGGNESLRSLDNGQSPHGCINQRLQIQFWSS